MNSTKAILENHLNTWEEKYGQLVDVDEKLIEIKNQLELVDFNEFAANAEAAIITNLKKWWTNPSVGIKRSEKLYAILFEYNISTSHGDAYIDCVAYGINHWPACEAHTDQFDMGFDYDFATEFYSLPAFSMIYMLPIMALEPKDLKRETQDIDDLEDIKGYLEISNIFKYKGYLKLNVILHELEKKGIFDSLNRHNNFLFLIQEHDSESTTPLLT